MAFSKVSTQNAASIVIVGAGSNSQLRHVEMRLWTSGQQANVTIFIFEKQSLSSSNLALQQPITMFHVLIHR